MSDFNSSEEADVVSMSIETSTETPAGNSIPVVLTLTFPKGFGMAALVAIHNLSHEDMPQLYSELLKHGDESAQALEGKLLIAQLEHDLKNQPNG